MGQEFDHPCRLAQCTLPWQRGERLVLKLPVFDDKCREVRFQIPVKQNIVSEANSHQNHKIHAFGVQLLRLAERVA